MSFNKNSNNSNSSSGDNNNNDNNNNNIFEPKYFFDAANQTIPKRNWNGEHWYKIAETRVFFTKEIFWKVIVRIKEIF